MQTIGRRHQSKAWKTSGSTSAHEEMEKDIHQWRHEANHQQDYDGSTLVVEYQICVPRLNYLGTTKAPTIILSSK